MHLDIHYILIRMYFGVYLALDFVYAVADLKRENSLNN